MRSNGEYLLDEGLGFSVLRFVAQVVAVRDGHQASPARAFAAAVGARVANGVEPHRLRVVYFVLKDFEQRTRNEFRQVSIANYTLVKRVSRSRGKAAAVDFKNMEFI